MKRLMMAALAACVCATAAWAQDPGVTDKEIVVGATTPFTGPAGVLGYATAIGSQIAAAEINAAGGINGRMIKFVPEDDGYVPARTVQQVQKLIDVDKIFALTSASGAASTLAVLPMLEEKGIPSVTPLVASLATFDPVRKTHFGIGMAYRDASFDLMKFIAAKKPGLKWAVIVQDDESGIDQEVGFVRGAKELNQQVVNVQRHKRGQTDFSAEVLRVKESGANAIFLGTFPAMQASIIRESKKLGMNLFVSTLWLSHFPPMIDLVGEEGDGMLLYDFVPSLDDPSMAGFLALAKKHANPADLPKMNRYTAIGYVAMKVLAEGMKQCGRNLTRACTMAKLEGLKAFKTGIMPPISFSGKQHLSEVTGYPILLDMKQKKFLPYPR
ncbi:MAG: hypothetical protein JWQ76_5287 [Ramlibacter sp.]|nr:hypothetical protein [Ramlibacter sp.]